MRIVFFGTPAFAATVLAYLLEKKASIIAVVTKPDKPRGRSGKLQPSAVKELAQNEGIPVFQPTKASDPVFAEEILRPLNADLFVVVAYSEILKENLLAMPRLGCINVHASILPKFRGAAPIQRCVMAGEKESGVTIMSMAPELDAGDILSIVKTPITQEMTSGQLAETLSVIGANALWEVIERLGKGGVQPIAQDAAAASYAKKLTSEDGRINWENPCEHIHNQIRGVTPKPGAWSFASMRGETKRLLIKKASSEPGLSGKPGTLLPGDSLIVGCGSGALCLLEIQLEGKKPVPAEAFLRGIDRDQFHLF